MKKTNNRDSANVSCTKKENKNINVDPQIEQQSVQQRYHKEFIKYQEQINKTKPLSSRNNQAA